MTRVDPITRQVIANRLESIPKEMAQIVQHTARSTIIVHGKDFSCGLLDAKGELLATPEGSPVHIFPVVAEVQFIQKKFGREIYPGDVFFANDYSEGGTHLNDVLLCTPLFFEDELVAFIAVRGHLVDVGGMSPGSITGAAQEIFQEGMRVPTIKLYEQGKLVKSLWEMFLFNVRLPEVNEGDLKALLAGCWMGEKRFREMFDRYGKAVVLAGLDEIHDAAERVMRSRIRELPNGTYVHEDYVDNDGVTTDPRMIRVSATVNGDSITMDLTGTAPQSQGPMNMGYGVSTGYSLMAVKVALDPGAQVKHGALRPVDVVLPPGSMAAAQPPAAVGSTGTTGALVAVGMGALAEILPRSVTAGENTTGNHFYFGGYINRGGKRERFIYYDYPAGGGGGRYGMDGIDATGSLRTGNIEIQSVEVLESAYPVLQFRQWRLWTGSGGAGEFRGGQGQIREYEAEEDGVLSILLSQCMVPAGGLFGGHAGTPNGCKVIRNNEEIDLAGPPNWGKVTGFPIKKGDLIRMQMSGGGGYGDPLDRDPARIASDLSQGLLTVEQARDVYGVVLDPESLMVDEARVTVRTNIDRLVGGATEETVIARVGEGIVTTIGSADNYMAVLENPDQISKVVLDRGLDAGTAFEILSIDIADIDVGENVGARLRIEQAEADKQVAQAQAERQRALAVAREQEMQALVQENRAKVVLAEALVPLAMAEAFRSGNLGLMYMADTTTH